MRRRIFKGAYQVFFALLFIIIFVTPVIYIIFLAGMTKTESFSRQFHFPQEPQYLKNLIEVINAGNRMLLRATWNSLLITVFSILILIVVAAMTAFILERRRSKFTKMVTSLVMAGLMIPPSVVTTIWILKGLGLYKTLPGIILIEVALNFPFAVVLFRGFMVTIPRELDEAAFMEGAGTHILFTKVIFPLLKPVVVTLIILSSVTIFNDFVNPLYFLPGSKNVTVQLTLYNFMSRYATQYNLLFMNILAISVPPLILFAIFNKRIIGGMVAGAIKS